jgi:hypothetical protein
VNGVSGNFSAFPGWSARKTLQERRSRLSAPCHSQKQTSLMGSLLCRQSFASFNSEKILGFLKNESRPAARLISGLFWAGTGPTRGRRKRPSVLCGLVEARRREPPQ